MTSHEAKMPEMPEELIEACWRAGRRSDIEKAVKAHGRACYLAGIAAARECVPANVTIAAIADEEFSWDEAAGFNTCRATTLSNLTALEQEAKK